MEQGAKGIVESLSFLFSAFVITKDGIVVGANAEFISLFDFEQEEQLIGMSALDLIIPDERSIMKSRFQSESTEQYELSILSNLNKVKQALVSPKLFFVKGEVYRLAEFVDITERKQAQQLLLQKEAELATAQRIAHLGRWRLDLLTDEMVWSAELYTMFGVDPSVQPPKFTAQQKLFVPQSWKNLTVALAHAREGGIPYELDLEIIKNDGSHGWVSAQGEAAKDEQGDIVGLHGVAMDITIRKQGEMQRKNALLQTVKSIALTVEKRDPYTAGHMHNVAALSVAIAIKMGFLQERIDGLELASLIHDIGKVYIPSDILSRPGKLTEAEFELVKSHSQVGYDIVKDIDFDSPVAEMVLQHHERLDGSGYPRGLKGEEILLEAQILGIADMMEAMSAHRPYRPALGIDAGIEIVSAEKGSKLNSAAVNACIEVFKEDGFEFSSIF